MKVGWPPGARLDTNQAGSPVLWQPTAPWFEGYGGFRALLRARLNVTFPKSPRTFEITATTTGPRHGNRITNQLIQLEVEQALYRTPGDLSRGHTGC